MSEWKPKLRTNVRFENLSLSGEEGFVLSRIDGTTSMKNLVHLTGLPEGRVQQIVEKLVQQGAIDGDATGSSPTTNIPRGAGPAQTRAAQRGGTHEDDEDDLELEQLADLLGENTSEGAPVDSAATDLGAPEADAKTGAESGDAPEETAAAREDERTNERTDERTDERRSDDVLEEDSEQDEDLQGLTEDDELREELAEKSEEGEGVDEEEESNHRRLFNETLSKLEPPAREALAKSAKDPELSALCFDPLPAVIRAVLENQAVGFTQARLIARHHHTPQGLDHVMSHAEFARDGQTQRLLLQNTMLQEPQIKRLLQAKRLGDIYKVTIHREIPERNRQKARNVLRHKWAVTEAEERAGLIFATEGRCLAQLTGLPFDSRTTSLLCSKTYTSNLMIQNLARFGATPPPVLAHLLKQQAVRRQQMLKNLILQHPNCPSDVKRKA